MRTLLLSSALLGLSLPLQLAPVHAQSAVTDGAAMVGKPVVDAKGAPVGQVVGARQGLLFVKTDKQETSLPLSSFTFMGGKLYIALTQAQLNAEVEKSLALMSQALAPGATVKGSAGNVLGAIEAIDTEFATIRLTGGQTIRIPRSSIAATPGGAVIGMTAAELEAAVAATAQ